MAHAHCKKTTPLLFRQDGSRGACGHMPQASRALAAVAAAAA
eukprot:CAMPEP_0172913268 /NCGR_PEP_ID=MMETSP1075-20121228/190057_1 /TAXON_ID=2916 /ORGANISM="Ceratium fusus, Strain PA161109" /LENGTH=41 /DNA_ID= /DNA_START= /DNA_END= /DNA_ORIENTATION=